MLDVLTLQEGKSAVNATATSAHDARLPGWITAVSLRLDRLVGPVVRRDATAALDGGQPRIHLPTHPNTSITTVTEYDGLRATVLVAESNLVKPADGYQVDRYSADPAYLSSVVHRRIGGVDAEFAAGRGNVEFVYVAGRFVDTAGVDERFKRAGVLMLKNLWRSVQDGTGQVDEFDVPQSIFPTFTVPRSVREMFPGEIQDPMPMGDR